LCGCHFINNRANELGGALFRTPNTAEGRNMRIDRCEFDGNTARMGGVSFIKDNSVVVVNTLVANQRAGVDINGEESGWPIFGGIWIVDGSLDMQNSTFFNNAPDGVRVEGGTAQATNCTFVESPVPGTIAVSNSIFSGITCSSTVSGSNNIQWPQGGTACAEGTAFVDPLLGLLSDNGGPTRTFMPGLTTGLAIGQSCPATDQRGESRPADDCTAGAVEP
jgi:hypothetical protein